MNKLDERREIIRNEVISEFEDLIHPVKTVHVSFILKNVQTKEGSSWLPSEIVYFLVIKPISNSENLGGVAIPDA
jgi:hypothetical protein